MVESPPPDILLLPHGSAPVQWRRSRRARRVSLRIDPRSGSVVVTLPLRAGRRAGRALLMDQAEWVARRLAALPAAVPLEDGACVPLHGIPHRIRHAPHERGGAWAEQGEIIVTGQSAFLARRVTDFLRAEARRSFQALVAAKLRAACIDRSCRITIKDTRSRWGSCAPDGSLAFSWRLVMAPPFVQDYVVAHEVAHLAHMNHGPKFWALVDLLTPHRTRAMAWLKKEGTGLLRVG
jgi:predicted metal-dependent hydrolase